MKRDSESFQLVRYYGWYSTRMRGEWRKEALAVEKNEELAAWW